MEDNQLFKHWSRTRIEYSWLWIIGKFNKWICLEYNNISVGYKDIFPKMIEEGCDRGDQEVGHAMETPRNSGKGGVN